MNRTTSLCCICMTYLCACSANIQKSNLHGNSWGGVAGNFLFYLIDFVTPPMTYQILLVRLDPLCCHSGINPETAHGWLKSHSNTIFSCQPANGAPFPIEIYAILLGYLDSTSVPPADIRPSTPI